MRILLASSSTFDDSQAVGPVIDELVQTAGGEIVTLVLLDGQGVTPIAQRIVSESVDAGLEVEVWTLNSDSYLLPEDFAGIETVFFWANDDDLIQGPGFYVRNRAHEYGIPTIEFLDTISQ